MHAPGCSVEDHGADPFPPLFSCAIVFGGAVRIVEILVIAISTRAGWRDFWLAPRVGSFGNGDLVFACACLFLVAAAMEVLARRQTRSSWATLLFCLLLLAYCSGLRFCPSSFS